MISCWFVEHRRPSGGQIFDKEHLVAVFAVNQLVNKVFGNHDTVERVFCKLSDGAYVGELGRTKDDFATALSLARLA
jgi:hypothetical protein